MKKREVFFGSTHAVSRFGCQRIIERIILITSNARRSVYINRRRLAQKKAPDTAIEMLTQT